MRILISNPDTIGDFVLRQPLLAALLDAGHELMLVVRGSVEPLARQIAPTAHVTVLSAEPYALSPEGPWEPFATLFEAARAFAPEVLVIAAYQWTLFDEQLARELPQVPRVGMSGYLHRGDPYAGTAPVSVLEFDRVVRVNELDAEVAKNAALASALLGRPIPTTDPVLVAPQEGMEHARQLLEEAGLQPGEFWVACVGGTVHVPIKSWPIERWGVAFAHWAKKYGRRFAFVGVPAERPAVTEVIEAMGDAVSDSSVAVDLIRPDLPLATLQGIIAMSAGYAGHDTGPMHIAAAMRRPTLAVFGQGHWPRFLPAVSPSVVLCVDVPCAGCGWVCAFDQSYCVKSLPVTAVMQAIDDLERGTITGRDVRAQTMPAELLARLTRESAQAAEARLREAAEMRKQLAVAQSEIAARDAAAAAALLTPPEPEPEPEPEPIPEPVVPEWIAITETLRSQVVDLQSQIGQLQRELDVRAPAIVPPQPRQPRRPLRQVLVEAVIGRQRIAPRGLRRYLPVSVIVPVTHNDEITAVSRSVDSVLQQDYPNREVVIVDDGRNESLPAYLSSLGDRVRKFTIRDADVYGLVRHGFEQSWGQVLSFLRPGAVYTEGVIQQAARVFVQKRFTKVLYFQAVRDDGPWRVPVGPAKAVDTLDFLNDEPVAYESIFWRRSAYTAIGGLHDTSGPAADWDLAVRTARMFGLHRIDSLGVIIPANLFNGSPERDAALVRARQVFEYHFGSLGRLRCGLIQRINRLNASFESTFSRKRLRFGRPNHHTPAVPLANAASTPNLPEAVDRLLFCDTAPNAVRQVYLSTRNGQATIIEQPLQHGGNGASLYTGYPLRKPWLANSGEGAARADDAANDAFSSWSMTIRGAGAISAARSLLDLSREDGKLCVVEAHGIRTYIGAPGNGKEPARRSGVCTLIDGNAFDAPLLVPDGQTFDLVLLGELLQQQSDPLAMLCRARTLMNPHGGILLTTANLDSFLVDVYGATWAGWARGKTVLSRTAIEHLAQAAGLRVAAIRTRTTVASAGRSVVRHRTGLLPNGNALSVDDAKIAKRLAGWAKTLYDWRGRGDVIHAVLKDKDEG